MLYYVSYSKQFIMTAQFKHYQLPDGLSEVVTLSLSAVLCWLGAVWQLQCQTVERCPSASRTEAGTRYFLEVWDRSRNRICILNTSLRDVRRKIWAPFVSLEPS